MISIIIPTYNEAGNIAALAGRIFKVLCSAKIPGEIIFVDDDSTDGTPQAVKGLMSQYPIKLIERKNEKGLASAVIEGIKHADAKIVGIMDADLSHPPEALPQMYNLVLSGMADIAVGSRLVKGGGASNWPWYRRITSLVARVLTWPITSVRDSTSGYLVFRKSIIDGVKLNPLGFKIGLEIICRAKHNKTAEVPIVFEDRQYGQSKLKAKPIIEYLKQLALLYAERINKAGRG